MAHSTTMDPYNPRFDSGALQLHSEDRRFCFTQTMCLFRFKTRIIRPLRPLQCNRAPLGDGLSQWGEINVPPAPCARSESDQPQALRDPTYRADRSLPACAWGAPRPGMAGLFVAPYYVSCAVETCSSGGRPEQQSTSREAALFPLSRVRFRDPHDGTSKTALLSSCVSPRPYPVHRQSAGAVLQSAHRAGVNFFFDIYTPLLRSSPTAQHPGAPIPSPDAPWGFSTTKQSLIPFKPANPDVITFWPQLINHPAGVNLAMVDVSPHFISS